MSDREIRLDRHESEWRGSFRAMAGPCEVLCSGTTRAGAGRAARVAAEEAWRIERKFSRYLSGSVVHRINHSQGERVRVDVETARLLDFADHCHQASGGAFDITSGVLGRVWKFDGSDRIPSDEAIRATLDHIGWNRVEWQAPHLHLPAGMQIDLGGIGKEYAVDRAAELVAALGGGSHLVNFGGDLCATGARADYTPWRIGIEDPDHPGKAVSFAELTRGALATSGDANRFLLRDGVRYGHILDPRNGRPVAGAPRSVTVQAATGTEAGLFATLAILRGLQAEEFLEAEGVRHWTFR